MSNTTAGVALREELVDLVRKELEAALKPYDEQGKGNKPRWYKPLRAVDTRLTANLAVNCFIDAAGNGWKLTKARERTGKAFVALMFEQLVYGTNDRIKMFERFKERMMKKLVMSIAAWTCSMQELNLWALKSKSTKTKECCSL